MTLLVSKIFFRLLLVVTIVISSCRPSSRPMTTYKEPALRIEIHELFKDIGKYHDKLIETKGLFHHGFEELALYSQSLYIQNGDTIKSIDHFNGLWIQFTITYPESEKFYNSLQNKMVIVKGIIDTTKTGHLGNYKGTLLYTEFKKELD